MEDSPGRAGRAQARALGDGGFAGPGPGRARSTAGARGGGWRGLTLQLGWAGPAPPLPAAGGAVSGQHRGGVMLCRPPFPPGIPFRLRCTGLWAWRAQGCAKDKASLNISEAQLKSACREHWVEDAWRYIQHKDTGTLSSSLAALN
ncbi:unnamed protein product [Caretta caretta]